jgi:hypothetical protein
VTAIIDQVNAYVASGDIYSNRKNSLISKLENVNKKLEIGQVNAAVNELQAFIDAVQAQHGKEIKVEAADDLIAQASAIIALLTPEPTPTVTMTPIANLLESIFSIKMSALLSAKAKYRQ